MVSTKTFLKNIKPYIMNRKNKLSYLLILTVLLITSGCSNDDDGAGNTEVSLQDLQVALDENPSDGQAIGTIQVTDGTAMNFSINSQSPS